MSDTMEKTTFDETSRSAIVQTIADRGTIVYQTNGIRPGFYIASGSTEWDFLGGNDRSSLTVFNVVDDFDAIADGDGVGGGTDNTAAFQACANAIGTAGFGIMYIPYAGTGIYRVDDAVTLPSKIHVIGESVYSQTWQFGAGVTIDATNITLGGETLKGVFQHLTNGHSITVEKLYIIGPESPGGSFPNGGLCGLAFNNNVYTVNLIDVTTNEFACGIFLRICRKAYITRCMTHHAEIGGLAVLGGNNIIVSGGYFGNTRNSTASHGNIVLRDYGTALTDVLIDIAALDETEGSSLVIDTCSHVYFRCPRVYTGINATSAGINIISSSHVTIDGPYIQRYGGSAVPGNTIKISSDSSNIRLKNVVTSPNGGGDISDSAPDTKYSNCILDGVYKHTVGANAYGGKIERYTKTFTLDVSGGATIANVAPSGAKLIGASLNNDTPITYSGGGATYDAAYSGGLSLAIGTAIAAAQNTKVTRPYDVNAASNEASAQVDITFTPDIGAFATGTIRAVVTYEVWSDIKDA